MGNRSVRRLLSALRDRRLVSIVVAAVAVRLVLVLVSAGSNDVFIWGRIADTIRGLGLVGAYEATWEANHPPLAALYMAAARGASETAGVPWSWLVKLPSLIGDAALAVMVWHVAARRFGDDRARQVTAIYLLNPLTVLLVGYHGNTDMAYVAFAFGAVMAIERGRPGLGGLAFGAALNVKLLPIALGAALLSLLLRRSGLARFLCGAFVAVIPQLTVAVVAPKVYWDNVITYQYPAASSWGFTAVEAMAREPFEGMVWYYHAHGRWLMTVALLAAAVRAHVYRFDAYQSMGLAGAVFLVFAPSFGVQYLAVVIPFVVVCGHVAGPVFLWTGGVAVGVAYANALTGGLPLTSIFPSDGPAGPMVHGLTLLAWTACLWLLQSMGGSNAGHAPSDTDRGSRPGESVAASAAFNQ